MTLDVSQYRLHGLQVFVVEDELLVSMQLEDMLAEFGCVITGVASSVEQAMSMAKTTEVIDAAVLDVNIGGQMIFPVADLLLKRDVPCIFSTGYATSELTERYPVCHTLSKPYAPEALAKVLANLASGAPGDEPFDARASWNRPH